MEWLGHAASPAIERRELGSVEHCCGPCYVHKFTSRFFPLVAIGPSPSDTEEN
jgi:hypothetical protein